MSADDRRGPPRLVSWLLGHLAPPSARDHVLGDLEEEFLARLRRTGRRGPAVRWYVSQALRSAPHLLRERLVPGPISRTPVDLRYALRSLLRSPTLTVVAVASLALGIGANTIAFTFVHGLLIESLPFPEADRLVSIRQTHMGRSGPWLSVPDFESIAESATTLTDAAALTPDDFIVQGDDEGQLLDGAEVSTNYFDVLGVVPLAGRVFGPQDQETDRVVISESLWERTFGGDPDAVGRIVDVEGQPTEIIGVVPRQTDVFGDWEVWIPIRTTGVGWRQSRGTDWIWSVGRLAPGVDPAANRAELSRIGDALAEAFPETNTDQGFTAVGLAEWLAGDMRTPLLILMGAVGLVLLITCANLAGLLLARAIARSREIATRVALGVSRSRLLGQLLTESLVLAVAGGALGIALALYGVPLIRALLPPDIPRLDQITVDGPVLLFSLGIALLSLLLFGVAPAWTAFRRDVSAALGERAPQAGRSHLLARRGLVVGQMALALVLLVGASVLLRSFARLYTVDLGIRTEGVVTARLPLVGAEFPSTGERTEHYRRLLEVVGDAPGVEAAGMVNAIPLRDVGPTFSFETADPVPVADDDRLAAFTTVLGDYFDVMDIDLVSGRTFDPEELDGQRPAVVVDEAFQRTFFPDGAVGRELDVVDALHPIVGVVESVPDASPSDDPRPRMYVPLTANVRQTMAVVAYGSLPSAQMLGSVQQAIASLDPRQTIQSPLAMSEHWSRSVRQERLMLGLLGAMGLIALFLAALGTYGILAFLVSQRTREIGIRMAMGADASSVRSMVLTSAGEMIVVGLVVGSALAAFGVRFLETVLYDTTPLDPLSFGGAATVLVVTAVLASYLPAVRATRTSPVEALRVD